MDLRLRRICLASQNGNQVPRSEKVCNTMKQEQDANEKKDFFFAHPGFCTELFAKAIKIAIGLSDVFSPCLSLFYAQPCRRKFDEGETGKQEGALISENVPASKAAYRDRKDETEKYYINGDRLFTANCTDLKLGPSPLSSFGSFPIFSQISSVKTECK